MESGIDFQRQREEDEAAMRTLRANGFDGLSPEDTRTPSEALRDLASKGKIALGPESSQPPETASKGYTYIGVETTGETTREEREELAKRGISSHPVGWGVAFARRENQNI